MTLNFRNFKDKKTEVVPFSPGVSSGSSSVDLGFLAQYIKPVVTNLGVKMDNDFNFDKADQFSGEMLFLNQLRQLAKVRSILLEQDFETVIQSDSTPRLL